MAFRTLTIDSSAEVHVSSGQLTVQRACDEKPLHVDLDDLACIVLANLDITLSTGAINMIAQHGITVLGVGRNYMTTSILLPFARNSRYSQIVDSQLGMSVPFQKQLWKRIMKQRIANQAEVLAIAGRPGYEQLVELTRSVRSGDPDNREAVGGRRRICPGIGNRRPAGYLPLGDVAACNSRPGRLLQIGVSWRPVRRQRLLRRGRP